MPQNAPRNVAVIGAGPAGLVTARELKREGHVVVVFERENEVGGTWIYTPATDSDPIGIDPNRRIVHSSLYSSLRVNLPREVMGFRDYPFVATNRDPRRYPGHREVLDYLNDFAAEFGLIGLVRFGTEVGYVGLLENGKWKVSSTKSLENDHVVVATEEYDAVVICNGRYTEPRIADDIPGIEVWPGKQIHSHNYRVPEPYRDQVIVIIGGATSATDISREIAEVAKAVHISSRSALSGSTPKKLHGYENLWLHSTIEAVCIDGGVNFQDGSKVYADIILHCTGYKYHFPFLETNGIVTVDDNRVGPLYKHIFPPAFAPSLSFVGLPWKLVPFPRCELQSKWIAGVLSGRISLLSKEAMIADIDAFYSSLDASRIPKRYTHNMDFQLDYEDWLAAQCGSPPPENWRKQMFFIARDKIKTQPDIYRDQWDDNDLIIQAHQDFAKYIPELAQVQKLST